MATQLWGSSPPTRGPLQDIAALGRLGGIIPAYAGTTFLSITSPEATRDHPRLRGDHWSIELNICRYWGSSPPTRGPRVLGGVHGEHDGIIPAYAGTTRAATSRATPRGDHPRLRGDHRAWFRPRGATGGSSPPTRGPHLVRAVVDGSLGIIPAYAGTTSETYSPDMGRRDHPRLRGDHTILIKTRIDIVGSSPPTRGPQSLKIQPATFPGIIPAYAGTTAGQFRYPHTAGDHPRLRGDHPPSTSRGRGSAGSSPPTRGPLQGAALVLVLGGIIPAYAGTTVLHLLSNHKIGRFCFTLPQ